MSLYRVLFCLVAAATATASVSPPALASSKFSSSKVLALRGGAKEVSDKAITSENFVKVAAALFVWNNYVENDNKWGTGKIADIPNWAKVAGVWFLFTQNEGDFSLKGDNAWMWLLAIPLFFSNRK